MGRAWWAGIPVWRSGAYCSAMVDENSIRLRYEAMRACLDERGRRLFAAAEARTATGIARSTIGRGLKDLEASGFAEGMVRRVGVGRRSLTRTDATLLDDLRRIIEPSTLGDPMRPLLWVSKSHAKLTAALCAMGHQVAESSIPKLLDQLHYRRQVNRTTKEGCHHPDRDAQFETSKNAGSDYRRRSLPG